mgnify:CR=1 FL=1
MDMEELWSKTREVLRAEVNAVVYNSLLGSNNLVPALLDGDTLVLRVVMDNLKLLITNQWYSTIVRALSQVAGHQMDVEILTQEEIEARPQLKQKAVEEQETVLERSSSAAATVLPMPPRCPSPLTRLIPTTRCLSTAV